MSVATRSTHDRHRHAGFPGWWPLAAQVFLVTAGALAYFAVRGLTVSDEVGAQRNARRVVDLEQALGLDWEAPIQRAVNNSDLLVTAMNWVYIYGHWPVIMGTLVWLFLRHPPEYYTLRNAMFISGGIGLIIFVLLPVAPPRFGAIDVIDTVTERSQSYRALQPPSLTNPYAAVPSLHFGWNLLVGLFLWHTATIRAVRVLALAIPPAMAVAVVATGNHFVLDVVAGGLVALAGLVAALALPGLRETPEWAR